MSPIGEIELVFLLLLVFVFVLGIAAQRLRLPYPIVMVVGGLVLGFIPLVPNIPLDPDIIFLVVLPPLLYSSAWTTSWRDFRYNLVSILLLAFGLVAFTVIGVAIAAPHLLTGFDWRLGLVLGAVVAPTDAIAASAIARRVGLPQRIVDVLEGESLINDASGLLALQFSTGILVHGQVPGILSGSGRFVWLIAGGLLVGAAIAWAADLIERRIDDGSIEMIFSIIIPYSAYLAADRLHASGVLAVIVCGLILSRRSVTLFSPSVRLQLWSVWQALTFVLNGLVFVLIGLQLPSIRASIHSYSLSLLIEEGLIFSLFLIGLRILWAFPGASAAWLIRTRLLGQTEPYPPPRSVFILGWTGMRGVISLAAALALPTTLASGAPFPNREFIVFLTFCVILVTLVLQGLTLPPLIRFLGLAGAVGLRCEEREARRLIAQSALDYLEQARPKDDPARADSYEDLASHYQERLAVIAALAEDGSGSNASSTDRLKLETLRVERETAIRLRDEGRINDEVLRRIERDLDLAESRLTSWEEI